MIAMLALLVACGGEAPPPPATVAPPPAPAKPLVPDWEKAVDLSAARTADGARLTFEVKDGFHVYGARETTSRPLRVEVEGHPDVAAAVPDGEPKQVAGVPDPAWVLVGTVGIDVPVPGAEGSLGGTLNYQVCTNTLCSMPTARPWTAEAAPPPPAGG